MRPGLRENLLVAEASSPSLFSANEVVFHESVHYLVRNASSFRYPTWFDEGFAQVLGTAYLDDGAILVGYPPKTAAYVMQYEKLMPVERLADTASTYELGTLAVGRFYATSWLLVHYLLLSDDPRLQQQAHQYLMANNAGRADFEATFGSFDAVDAALEKYGRGLPFGRIPMERISLQPEFHPQRLEPREIAYARQPDRHVEPLVRPFAVLQHSRKRPGGPVYGFPRTGRSARSLPACSCA